MKPSRFAYHAPATISDCVTLLAEHGDDAKPLAGGQSLVPLMNLRLAAPSVVVDLNRIGELAYVFDDGVHLVLGAMTRHRVVARSESRLERRVESRFCKEPASIQPESVLKLEIRSTAV